MNQKKKLFCIPYAGGRADLFREFAADMPKDITVIPLEYAGHGTRAKEDFYQNFKEMTRDVASIIEGQITEGEDFALSSVNARQVSRARISLSLAIVWEV